VCQVAQSSSAPVLLNSPGVAPCACRYGPAGGGGFLRLHSTYRHDLKIYSSDEGRVQVSWRWMADRTQLTRR
jgi:hypothetical protein